MHIFPNGKRYIGITSKRLKARWSRGNGYKSKNSPMYNAVQKYGWDNIEHIIIQTNLSQKEACQMEQDLIAKYKTNIHRYGNKYGYNLTDGGEGTLGHKLTEENIQAMRERTLGKTGKDCPNSRPVICDGKEYASLTEFKQKTGAKGRVVQWLNGTSGMPPEWYQKGLCYKDLGTSVTYPSKVFDQRNRKVIVDDIIFNTLKECADYLGVNTSNISLWLRNKKSPPNEIISKGLRYEDEVEHKFKEVNPSYKGRKVKCECDGVVFESLKEVSEYLGVKKGTVWGWLTGKNKMPEEYRERKLKYVE